MDGAILERHQLHTLRVIMLSYTLRSFAQFFPDGNVNIEVLATDSDDASLSFSVPVPPAQDADLKAAAAANGKATWDETEVTAYVGQFTKASVPVPVIAEPPIVAQPAQPVAPNG